MSTIDDYNKAFDAMDLDGNGEISREEYVHAFHLSHPEEGEPDWFPAYGTHKDRLLTQLLQEFDAFDADNSGAISRQEYVSLRQEQAASANDMRMFLELDPDGSGCIELEALEKEGQPGPDGQVSRKGQIALRMAAALKRYDVDGDGNIWLDEFLAGQRRARQAAAAKA
jgi:Ca2+-binding EF-hand superfamily protein